jgi:hypothetical protein
MQQIPSQPVVTFGTLSSFLEKALKNSPTSQSRSQRCFHHDDVESPLIAISEPEIKSCFKHRISSEFCLCFGVSSSCRAAIRNEAISIFSLHGAKSLRCFFDDSDVRFSTFIVFEPDPKPQFKHPILSYSLISYTAPSSSQPATCSDGIKMLP